MAKRIGVADQKNENKIRVEGLSDPESAKVIAHHSPINLQDLPSYLPAWKALQIDEYSVYERINKPKKTK